MSSTCSGDSPSRRECLSRRLCSGSVREAWQSPTRVTVDSCTRRSPIRSESEIERNRTLRLCRTIDDRILIHFTFARLEESILSSYISGLYPPARTGQRRRRSSASSTWSSSRPRSTAPWRRAPRRTSSLPTRRSRPSTTTRSSMTSTRRRRASWPSNGPHSPTRYRCRQRRESSFSEPPVTGLGGTGRERQEQGPTRLYDQRGDGVRDASRLDAILDGADDAVWLVPAMALTESTGEAAADRQVSSVPTTQELDRQNCGRVTDHRFKTHESIPDEAWTGQPIWEYRVCSSARYGPSLE